MEKQVKKFKEYFTKLAKGRKEDTPLMTDESDSFAEAQKDNWQDWESQPPYIHQQPKP